MSWTWKPWGARRTDGLPVLGGLVAEDHVVWFVRAVTAIAPASELPGSRTHEVLLDARTGPAVSRTVATSRYGAWWTYPGRFPVCSCCGEPPPCRSQVAEDDAAEVIAVMHRFETAAVCPGCCRPVSRRQRTVTFPENVVVPLGPPVSFHLGAPRCRGAALDYERRWLEHHPGREPLLGSQPNGRRG